MSEIHPAPRTRLALDLPLVADALCVLDDRAGHYLQHVLRLRPGERIAVFSRADGEWLAQIASLDKRQVTLRILSPRRAAALPAPLTVCFAPIKGGRGETIIEKATELGAAALQPVITAHSIAAPMQPARAEAIAREAAEQCERVEWPRILPPLTLPQLLGQWPVSIPLLYGDERRESPPVTQFLLQPAPSAWATLCGPEGGFSAAEFALLRACSAAQAVSLGPRILRADTANITLAALTIAAWGDWNEAGDRARG